MKINGTICLQAMTFSIQLLYDGMEKCKRTPDTFSKIFLGKLYGPFKNLTVLVHKIFQVTVK